MSFAFQFPIGITCGRCMVFVVLLSDGSQVLSGEENEQAMGVAAKGEVEEGADVDEEDVEPTPRDVPDEGRILGIHVHRTDKLKSDFYIAHPLVRLHIIDVETGNYLKKQHK